MLGKLMKYDLRYCLRRIGPLWIAAVALSIISGLYFNFVHKLQGDRNFILNLFITLLPVMLFGVFVAIIVLTLMFVCGRFYKGLLGDEGYLMHTLPVTAETHIASKGLTALILQAGSSIVALLCAVLVPVTFQPIELAKGWSELLEMLRGLDFPAVTPLLILEALLLVIAMTAAETLKIYAAISLGHLAKRHRVFYAILAYLGINVALNIIMGAGVSTGLLSRLAGNFDWTAFSGSGTGVIAGGMASVILWELLIGTAFFFITRTILKNHLNLE